MINKFVKVLKLQDKSKKPKSLEYTNLDVGNSLLDIECSSEITNDSILHIT